MSKIIEVTFTDKMKVEAVNMRNTDVQYTHAYMEQTKAYRDEIMSYGSEANAVVQTNRNVETIANVLTEAISIKNETVGVKNDVVGLKNETENLNKNTVEAKNETLQAKQNVDNVATTLTTVYNNAIASGTVQAPIIDNTLTISGAGADAKIVGMKFNDVAECVRKVDKNLLNNVAYFNGFLNNNVVTLSSDYYHTDYIKVEPNSLYKFIKLYAPNTMSARAGFRFVCFYNAQKEYLSTIRDIDAEYAETGVATLINTTTDCCYIRITFYSKVGDIPFTINDFVLFNIDKNIWDVTPHKLGFVIKNIVDYKANPSMSYEGLYDVSKNLINTQKLESGFLEVNGHIEVYDSYVTTDYIKIKKDRSYTISNTQSKGVRFYAIFDENGIFYERINENTTPFTITPAFDGYIRLTLYTNSKDFYQMEEGVNATSFEPYKKTLTNEFALNDTQIKECEDIAKTYQGQAYNILSGKKWVACGDSFTVAGYNEDDGFPKSEYEYQDGIYKGKQIVYPYIIGLRNNMTVVNLAVGGMTMCDVNGTRENSFTHGTNPVYKRIPADADYITIKLGINDSNQQSPVGTIDDTDIKTFYGAYNTALDYITQNYPFAHIGIIVTNGSEKKYTDATIALAQKWGIAYIDEVNDPTVPLLHRADRAGVSSVAKQRKLNAFAVNIATHNTHPNVKAHYYEAAFIEDWLRRL